MNMRKSNFRAKSGHIYPQLLEGLERRTLLSAALLDPMTQPRFVNELPTPAVMQPTSPGGHHYEVSISQFAQPLGLYADGDLGQPLQTTVWGYNGSYPGPTIEARKDQRITVRWNNDLVDAQGNPLPHLLPVDTSVHWANPSGWPDSGVPIVTHLHGGHTESASDGLPEAWYTPGFEEVGSAFVKKTYRYDNDQEAATIWYHDHALGITRLNVYAGLAGFYLIRDPWEQSLNLPSGAYELPIAIQDRMFTEDGQLYYPSEPEGSDHGGHGGMMAMQEMEVPSPTVLPEFFGNFILVNGQAWPKKEVEPTLYRVRLLNGSDSRFYRLWLDVQDSDAGPDRSFAQIGTDSGLLNQPVLSDYVTIAPGERFDLLIDFAGLEGKRVILRNDAGGPFKGFNGDGTLVSTLDPDDPAAMIMAFDVGGVPAEAEYTPYNSIPGNLRPAPIAPLVQDGATRQVALFEMTDAYGRLMPMLGTVDQGALMWDDPTTENPRLNDVEVWEIYNNTEDTHPIHLHLVSFQILSRQKFIADVDEMTGVMSNIQFVGDPTGPYAFEDGWKDTVQVHPGEVVRIVAKFDRPGEYAWHCHILSHEDHEMMRRIYVGQQPKGQLKKAADDAPMEHSVMTSAAVAPIAAQSPVAPAPRPAVFSTASIRDLLHRDRDPLN